MIPTFRDLPDLQAELQDRSRRLIASPSIRQTPANSTFCPESVPQPPKKSSITNTTPLAFPLSPTFWQSKGLVQRKWKPSGPLCGCDYLGVLVRIRKSYELEFRPFWAPGETSLI